MSLVNDDTEATQFPFPKGSPMESYWNMPEQSYDPDASTEEVFRALEICRFVLFYVAANLGEISEPGSIQGNLATLARTTLEKLPLLAMQGLLADRELPEIL